MFVVVLVVRSMIRVMAQIIPKHFPKTGPWAPSEVLAVDWDPEALALLRQRAASGAKLEILEMNLEEAENMSCCDVVAITLGMTFGVFFMYN